MSAKTVVTARPDAQTRATRTSKRPAGRNPSPGSPLLSPDYYRRGQAFPPSPPLVIPAVLKRESIRIPGISSTRLPRKANKISSATHPHAKSTRRLPAGLCGFGHNAKREERCTQAPQVPTGKPHAMVGGCVGQDARQETERLPRPPWRT